MVEFPNYYVFLALSMVFTSAKSEDHDEMQHYAEFHLGKHCLSITPLERNKRTSN